MSDDERRFVWSEGVLEAWVEAWHRGAGDYLELYEYLGWTREEYGLWVQTGRQPGEA